MTPEFQAGCVGGVVRRRERRCAILGSSTQYHISTNIHATPFFLALLRCLKCFVFVFDFVSPCHGERDVPCHPVATRRS